MHTLPNNIRDCAVLKTAKRCLHMGLTRFLFIGVISLMCFNAALALDINQANEAELDSVKGMGPALSAKVLKAREEGAFKNWADLMKRVSGVRQNKAKQFSEQGLTVAGQAFAKKP